MRVLVDRGERECGASRCWDAGERTASRWKRENMAGIWGLVNWVILPIWKGSLPSR